MAINRSSPWFLYILRCCDGSLYTGVTRDPQRRLAEHNGEQRGGARYTRARRPVTLVYTEAAADRATACRREAEVKRWPRHRKLDLIRGEVGPEL